MRRGCAAACALCIATGSAIAASDEPDNATARREAAFAIGAQYVSTDYMQADTRLSPYRVPMPGGVVAPTVDKPCTPGKLLPLLARLREQRLG